MNNRNIIIAGVTAIGLYILSRSKKIYATTAQKVAQRIRPTATPSIRQRTAQKIAQKIGKKVAQKVVQKVVPQIPEETGGRTGMALVIYLQKKARAMHAQVTQAVNAARTGSKIRLPSSKWAGGRTGMALVMYLKKREVAIAQALSQAKAAVPNTKLFPGAEKSRIIPYSESSKHSYYGPKSRKLQNEGYRVESNKRLASSVEANHDKVRMEVLSNPKLWKK